jgi:uncharacterized membrane protein
MTQSTLEKILAIGAVTGMRSMAGIATLSLARAGMTRRIMPALALGEMILDKTPFAGDRIDALPLAGRASLGALTGGVIAREHGDSAALGGLLGAASAIATAHLAYHARKGLSWPNVAGGLAEDAIVLAIAARYV